jgi:hypothetical protein
VAHNNLARALELADQMEQAEAHYRRAVEFDPKNPELHANLGEILRRRGHLRQAIQPWRKAIEIAPKHARSNWALALGLLTLGDYDEGWKLYARRFELGQAARFYREYPVPHWTGQDLSGKTILLYPEQGYGDVIMFCRFVDVLAKKGARVLLHMPSELVELMKCVDGVSQVIGPDEPLPHFDLHQALLTVPSVLGLKVETIPARIPYIRVDATKRQHFAKRMAASNNLKVGLFWMGRVDHIHNAERSISLSTFAPLFDVPGVSFFSLQVGDGAWHLAQIESPIIDLGPDLKDFTDTAAAIANLDLLITVDTAVAHLAGAIGSRAWVPLHFTSDFRWFEDREDSPWYPTIRLFRQRKRKDWHEVISRVRDELLKFNR